MTTSVLRSILLLLLAQLVFTSAQARDYAIEVIIFANKAELSQSATISASQAIQAANQGINFNNIEEYEDTGWEPFRNRTIPITRSRYPT